MSAISVLMIACNAEAYITEAIESVLNQSFSDFELIIVNDGSSDNTRAIINSCADKRIRIIDNERNYVQSLNLGLKAATGKYIARMGAEDISHVDRLKIQHAIMEDHPEITLCSSWVNLFGEKVPAGFPELKISGMIENPFIDMLSDDFTVYPTAMLRSSFVRENDLLFENYFHAEEYHFWAKVAMADGVIYIESQPLVYKRMTETQLKIMLGPVRHETVSVIKKELLGAFCNRYREKYPSLLSFIESFFKLSKEKLITEQDIFKTVADILNRNREVFKD